MYFAVIRFEPFNAGSRLMGRIKLAISADVWLQLPPTARTMTGPETGWRERPSGRQIARAQRWADAMGTSR